MLPFDADNLPSTFCSAAWLQIHTEPTGQISPCCYFDFKNALGDWNKSSLQEVYNSKQWNTLRRQFINNEKPNQCQKCWKEEDIGIQSSRQLFNVMYSLTMDTYSNTRPNKLDDIVRCSNIDGTVVDDLTLVTADLIFSNLCNFSCRSCSPDYSTGWLPDHKKLHKIRNNKEYDSKTLSENSSVIHLKEDLQYLISRLDDQSEVHFTGGEPMMHQDHYTFLKMLLESGKTKLRIRYNTNLSIRKLGDVDIFDILKNFDHVLIVGSIDAMGEQGEYIRHGFNWQTALNWLDTAMMALPNAKFGINTVYSILNSLAAIDLQQYMSSQTKYRHFGFYLNKLHGPLHLKATLLPPPLKKEVTENISRHIQWLTDNEIVLPDSYMIQHWKDISTFMNSTDDSHQIGYFLKETRLLDSLRNQKFETTFPELFRILEDYE